METNGNRISKVKDEEFSGFLSYLTGLKGYSGKTALSYGEDVASFLLFLSDEGKKKEEVNRELIQTYLLSLRRKNRDSSSIKRKLSALRHFYLYLHVYHGRKDNPFETISSPKKAKKLPEFLSEKEINDFLDSNRKRTDRRKLRDQAVLELLFASGLRASELISRRRSDRDKQRRLIHVKGKGKKDRRVPFSSICLTAIEKYEKELRSQLLGKKEDSGILFLNQRGEPLTERGLEYLVSKAAEKSGFTLKVHPHRLRHSFATELLNNGADLRVIQEFLGHESVRTTSIYTHVTYQDLKNTYDKCFPDRKEKK